MPTAWKRGQSRPSPVGIHYFTYGDESWQESPFRSALQSGQQRLFLSVERNAAHDFIVPVYKIQGHGIVEGTLYPGPAAF